jgi:hypothetical protein
MAELPAQTQNCDLHPLRTQALNANEFAKQQAAPQQRVMRATLQKDQVTLQVLSLHQVFSLNHSIGIDGPQTVGCLIAQHEDSKMEPIDSNSGEGFHASCQYLRAQ